MKYRLVIILLMLASAFKPALAEVIVRMEMQQGTTTNYVDVKLLDSDAPLTVTNFLTYVNNGDYDNSFFHRSVPGFVVQGGGFTFDSLNGVQSVPVGPSVLNEFGNPNLRATIAMAKLTGEPNSATNQWFFNLANNSAFLDVDNGGFTVFGEVLNTGMTVVDAIADMPVCVRTDIYPSFYELPLSDCAVDPVQSEHLMLLKTVKKLFSVSPDLKFGLVASGSASQSNVVITNTGSVDLLIGDIVSSVSPFTIVDSTCTNITLISGGTCSISVMFAPLASATAYSGSLNIAFPGLGLDYEVALSGFGGASMDEFFTITSTIDFGTVTAGSGVQPEFTIQNTGNDILHIGGIGSINSLALPFSLEDTRCDNVFIQPGEQCSDLVRFKPDSVGSFTDSFNIEIINYGISYEVALLGDGVTAVAEPDIHLSFSSIDYGIVDVLENDQSLPYGFTMIVQNKGGLDMDFSSFDVTGDVADIYVENLGCVNLSVLEAGFGCSFLVRFKPLTPGVKNAVISITTNDPDEGVFNVPVTGTAIGEDDGVPAAIEDAGPNNGDGNNDGILDSKQSNVATLVDAYGNYVTYQTVNSFQIKNMSALQPTDVTAVPANLVIGSGIFDFTIQGLAPGQLIELGVILPAGSNPGAYYIYGQTADNPVEHWFNFDFDGETGASAIQNATFTTSTGATFTRSLFKIFLKDAGRSDTDMTENGEIKMTSAISVGPPPSSDDGSGLISLLQLFGLTFTLVLARCFVRVK